MCVNAAAPRPARDASCKLRRDRAANSSCRAVFRKISGTARQCPLNKGFCDVTNFDSAAAARRNAVHLSVFTVAMPAGAARCRAVKKIMHRTALRVHWRLPPSAKRTNRCQPIRAHGVFGVRIRRSTAGPHARFSISICSFATRRDARSATQRRDAEASRSEAELVAQEVVDGLRIGFAARRLHHLADEPADRLRVRFGVGDLVRVLADDVVDDLLDSSDVGDLL